MKKLVRVDDLYKDGTTFFKTLQKGVGTASPYPDCFVRCKFKVNQLTNLNSKSKDSGGWSREILSYWI